MYNIFIILIFTYSLQIGQYLISSMHNIQIAMLRNQVAFHKAVRDLKLRIKNNEADDQELHKVLMQILAYPIVQEAEKHHRASNMGLLDLLSNQAEMQRKFKDKQIETVEVCPCCGFMVQNQQLPYCTSLSDISMGVGVHLFFRNYLVNALIFFLMFIIYSIYAFSTNLSAFNKNEDSQKQLLCIAKSATSEEGCQFSAIGAGSKVLTQNDQNNNYSQIQAWIGVGFTILWGLIFIIKTHADQQFLSQREIERISASDFTLMLTHFPKRILNQPYQDVLKYLNQIFASEEKKYNSIFSYEVVKFNIARPLYADKKLNEKKKQQVKQELRKRQDIFRRWIRYRQKNVDFPIPFTNRMQEYEKYENYFSTHYEFNINYQIELEQKNIVFVTMRSSKAREEIQKMNPHPSLSNLWGCCSKNNFPIKGVHIRRAPEPEQIKWKNVGFSDSSRYKRKALLWLLTLLLIAISLGISIGIARINQDKISAYVSVGISLVVTASNVGIQLLIMVMSTLENEFITSVEQSNIAFKIGIGQLINSIGVPIVVTIIANADSGMEDKKWLIAGGLVDDVFYIALFSLLVPFGRLIDPWEIFLKLRRWWASDPEKRLQMYGQEQLNKLYGNYQFDIGYQYSYLIKTSIFTAFFAPMQPMIVIFAPFGLFLYYLIDKRNLLRHFQRPTYHSPEIDNTVNFILLFSLLAFGFGSLLVNNFLREGDLKDGENGTLVTNWIIVGIGALFLVIVPFKIFYYCLSRPRLPLWDYEQKKSILNSDYDRLNPATKSQAIGKFQDYLNNLNKEDKLPLHSQLLRMSIIRNRKNEENKKMLGSRSLMSFNIEGPQYNYNLDQYRNIAQNLNRQGSGQNLNSKH